MAVSFKGAHSPPVVILMGVPLYIRRGRKGITRPMLGSHSFHSAQHTLAGIELMRMIKKGRMAGDVGEALSAAEQFYALAS